MHLAPQVVGRLCGLKTQETSAKHHTALVVLCMLDDAVEILQGPVPEDTLSQPWLKRCS